MNPDHLDKIRATVREEIKTTVNGKVDNMNRKLDLHILEHDKLMEKLDPVVDAVRWINSSRRFIVWIAAPIAALAVSFATVKGWFFKN